MLLGWILALSCDLYLADLNIELLLSNFVDVEMNGLNFIFWRNYLNFDIFTYFKLALKFIVDDEVDKKLLVIFDGDRISDFIALGLCQNRIPGPIANHKGRIMSNFIRL